MWKQLSYDLVSYSAPAKLEVCSWASVMWFTTEMSIFYICKTIITFFWPIHRNQVGTDSNARLSLSQDTNSLAVFRVLSTLRYETEEQVWPPVDLLIITILAARAGAIWPFVQTVGSYVNDDDTTAQQEDRIHYAVFSIWYDEGGTSSWYSPPWAYLRMMINCGN